MPRENTPAITGVTLDDILAESRTVTATIGRFGTIGVTYNPNKYDYKADAVVRDPKKTDRDWLELMDVTLDTAPLPTKLTPEVLAKLPVPYIKQIALAVYRDYFPSDEPAATADAGGAAPAGE